MFPFRVVVKGSVSVRYLEFMMPIFLWGWALSSIYARFVIPRIASLGKAVTGLRQGAYGGGFFAVATAYVIRVALSLSQMYVLGTWSAYCVLRAVSYAAASDVTRWHYMVGGAVLAEFALAIVGRAEQYDGFLSVFHTIMAMGAVVIFSMNPFHIKAVYPWLMKLMEVSF
jgi:hypothetical protein